MSLRLSVFLACMGMILSTFAQAPRNSPLQIGGGMFGVNYLGDLTDSETALNRVYPGGNISLQFDTPARLRFQWNAGLGKFMEQYDYDVPDPTPGIRSNIFIETSFFYTDARLQVFFLKDKRVTPFVSAGAGIMIFSPKDQKGKLLGDALITRPEGETYNTAIPNFPVSLGFKARINPILSLGLDYIYRYTPTDYLDNLGELGRTNGQDHLHALQFNLYFTIAPGEPYFPPEPIITPPDEENPPATFAVDEPSVKQEYTIEPADKPNYIITALPSIQPVQSISDIRIERTIPTTVELPKPPVKPVFPVEWIDPLQSISAPTLAVPQKAPPKKAPPYDSVNWVKLEEEAIYNGKYIYYRVKGTDNLQIISRRFKTRIPTILKLNFSTSEEIYEGTYIRLPNLGIPADIEEREKRKRGN